MIPFALVRHGGACKTSCFADRCRALLIPFYFRHLPCSLVFSFPGNAASSSPDSFFSHFLKTSGLFLCFPLKQHHFLIHPCSQQGSHSSRGQYLLTDLLSHVRRVFIYFSSREPALGLSFKWLHYCVSEAFEEMNPLPPSRRAIDRTYGERRQTEACRRSSSLKTIWRLRS